MSSSILILGASYGSLLATKLLMAGHRVCLVCTRPTAEMINREGTVVRFPVKGRSEPVVITATCSSVTTKMKPAPPPWAIAGKM